MTPYKRIFCALIVLPLLVLGCNRGISVSSDNGLHVTIYANSFESVTDTSGWSGYGLTELVDQPAPSGGKHSARISGGCVIPHAVATFQGPSQAGFLSLKCWAKDLAIGGSLELSLRSDPASRIVITVHDSTWTRYATGDSLFCPAGDSLRLELISGGYASSAMLVDRIEVIY